MRLAETRDTGSLAIVYQDAVTHANMVGKIDWPDPIPESFVANLIASEELYCFEEEGVIAAAKLSQEGDERVWEDYRSPALYLAKLATSNQVRRQDYFRNIMLPAIVDFAGQKKSLRLDCLADNLALQKYYIKLGFIRIGSTSFYSENQQKIIKVTRFERQA